MPTRGTRFVLVSVGAFFGSFANVVSLRLHTGKKGIIGGRSHCPICNHQLGGLDLVPVFSWLFLRGKCRYCGVPISWQYPATEFLCGALFAFAAYFFGAESMMLAWATMLVFVLGILIISDLRYMDLPDQVTIPTIFFLIIAVVCNAFMMPFGLLEIQESLLGFLVGYTGLFFLAALAYWKHYATTGQWKKFGGICVQYLTFPFEIVSDLLRGKKPQTEDDEVQPYLGGGDVRLGMLMGIVLGPQLVLVAFFLSFVGGALFSVPLVLLSKNKRDLRVPFGPYLIAAMLITMVWGQQLLDWYLLQLMR